MAFQGRVTVFFQLGDYGWTENYFNNAGNYGALITNAQNLAAVRIGLSTSRVLITAVRVSDDTVFRDSLVRFFQPPLQGTFSGTCQHATVACLMRLVASPLTRRPLYVRGIPDAIIDGFGAYLPTPAWLGAVSAFRSQITNGQWQIKGVTIGLLNPKINLVAITPPNNFTMAGLGMALNPGDVVLIGGSSRGRNPTGRHKVVTVTSPISFTAAGVDLPADYVYHPFDCYVQKKTPDFATITNLEDERLTERKAGRPFGQPRGRRSPRRV